MSTKQINQESKVFMRNSLCSKTSNSQMFVFHSIGFGFPLPYPIRLVEYQLKQHGLSNLFMWYNLACGSMQFMWFNSVPEFSWNEMKCNIRVWKPYLILKSLLWPPLEMQKVLMPILPWLNFEKSLSVGKSPKANWESGSTHLE